MKCNNFNGYRFLIVGEFLLENFLSDRRGSPAATAWICSVFEFFFLSRCRNLSPCVSLCSVKHRSRQVHVAAVERVEAEEVQELRKELREGTWVALPLN